MARNTKTNRGANLGFEATLWAAADKLRGHMDAAEYKHVVLGLIFLKYISDAFEKRYTYLLAVSQGKVKPIEKDDEYADPEGQDEYVALSPQGERGSVHQFGGPTRTKLIVICDDESCQIGPQDTERLIQKCS